MLRSLKPLFLGFKVVQGLVVKFKVLSEVAVVNFWATNNGGCAWRNSETGNNFPFVRCFCEEVSWWCNLLVVLLAGSSSAIHEMPPKFDPNEVKVGTLLKIIFHSCRKLYVLRAVRSTLLQCDGRRQVIRSVLQMMKIK